jgi:hypothetical protein
MASMSGENLPPADELHAVRDDIKRLRSRESELKAVMIADPSARTGNSYAVDVVAMKTTRTDLKELRNIHPEIAAEFTFEVTETRVELRGISEDGEITRLRRKPAA